MGIPVVRSRVLYWQIVSFCRCQSETKNKKVERREACGDSLVTSPPVHLIAELALFQGNMPVSHVRRTTARYR